MKSFRFARVFSMMALLAILCVSAEAGVKINIRLGSGRSCPPSYPYYYGPVYYPSVIYTGPVAYGYPWSPFYYYNGSSTFSSDRSSDDRGQWITMDGNPSPSDSDILREFAANHPRSIKPEVTSGADDPATTGRPSVAVVIEEDPHEWQRQAAEEFRADALRGVIEARYNLASAYEAGLGVSKDVVEAYRWYSLAGATERRDRLARGMTAEQIEDAKARIAATALQPSMAGP